MSKQYTFSVIIPTYNTGKIICETLDSLVAQTYKDFEVIVSDDGSQDDTLKYVADYSSKLNLKILSNPNWGGPARPRNLGIMQASAEWIAFLDHDDFWFENKLKRIHSLLNDNDVIFHDLKIFRDGHKTLKKIRGRNLQPDPFQKLMIYGNAIANSSAVVRKSIVQQVGLIDESRELMAVEDFDLWLKISRITKRFYYLNETLGGYRLITGQNMTAQNQKQIDRYTAVVKKYFDLLSEEGKSKAMATLSYSIARILHKLNYREEALQNYKCALSSERNDIKIKSLIGIIQLIIGR